MTSFGSSSTKLFSTEDAKFPCVRIQNLQSDAGQRLNGKIGRNTTVRASEEDGGHILYDEDTRRQEIKIPGIRYRQLIKEANLTPVLDSDLVQVIRLHAKGENCHGMMEVLLYPSDHPMFEESGNSPVMERCGIPLVIKKVKPKSKLTHQAEYDNQWATWCMIDTVYGMAPMEWQKGVGPVLIYRPGGLNFNDSDMDIVGDYLGHLLDCFGDDPEHAHRMMTPTAFQEFKNNLIQCREENQNLFLEMNGGSL